MTLASIERRLAKVETARRPPRGLFFVAWGRTPAEIKAEIAKARNAALIADGDPIVRCAWPVEYPMPASRWAIDQMREFDKPEFGALMGEVDRLMDEWVAALRADAHDRDEPEPDPAAVEAARPPSDGKARTLHDAALFAAVLAAPLSGDRTSLTEDRLWRVVRYIEELGLRDRIRGRDEAMLRATERAGRPTQH